MPALPTVVFETDISDPAEWDFSYAKLEPSWEFDNSSLLYGPQSFEEVVAVALGAFSTTHGEAYTVQVEVSDFYLPSGSGKLTVHVGLLGESPELVLFPSVPTAFTVTLSGIADNTDSADSPTLWLQAQGDVATGVSLTLRVQKIKVMTDVHPDLAWDLDGNIIYPDWWFLPSADNDLYTADSRYLTADGDDSGPFTEVDDPGVNRVTPVRGLTPLNTPRGFNALTAKRNLLAGDSLQGHYLTELVADPDFGTPAEWDMTDNAGLPVPASISGGKLILGYYTGTVFLWDGNVKAATPLRLTRGERYVFEIVCSYLGISLPDSFLKVLIGGLELVDISATGMYRGVFVAENDEELTISGHLAWHSLDMLSIKHQILEGT